jgi:hypothetical protein
MCPQAAQLLAVSVYTLRAWRTRERAGPPYTRLSERSAGAILYRLNDLVDFIESNTRRSAERRS